MKNLRKYIRSLLVEGLLTESMNPKIQSLLEKLKSYRSNFYIEIKREARQLTVNIRAPQHKGPIVHMRLVNAEKKYKLPCGGAHVISWTADSAGQKLGPLLYDIVIELLTLVGSGLTADKQEVSHPMMGEKGDGYAHMLWLFYSKARPDMTRVKLDPHPFEFTPAPDDDCPGDSSLTNWYRDNTPAYKKFFSKTKGKRVYPKKEDFYSYIDKTGVETPSLGGVDYDSFTWGKEYYTKANLDKLMPAKHKAMFRKDWEQDNLPLSVMLTKPSTPVLKQLKSMGVQIKIKGSNGYPIALSMKRAYDSLGTSAAAPPPRKKRKSPATGWNPESEWEAYKSATRTEKAAIRRRWNKLGYSAKTTGRKNAWEKTDLMKKYEG